MGNFCDAISHLYTCRPIEALFVLSFSAFEGLHADSYIICRDIMMLSC